MVSGDNKHFCIWSVCRWLKRMSEAFAIRWLISANKSYCVRVHVWRQSINKIRDYWGIPTVTTSSTATTLKNRNNQIIAKYKLSELRNQNIRSTCTKISTNGPSSQLIWYLKTAILDSCQFHYDPSLLYCWPSMRWDRKHMHDIQLVWHWIIPWRKIVICVVDDALNMNAAFLIFLESLWCRTRRD